MSDIFLKTKEVARRLGVTPNTVIKWGNDGRLPYTKINRNYKWLESEVNKEIAKGKSPEVEGKPSIENIKDATAMRLAEAAKGNSDAAVLEMQERVLKAKTKYKTDEEIQKAEKANEVWELKLEADADRINDKESQITTKATKVAEGIKDNEVELDRLVKVENSQKEYEAELIERDKALTQRESHNEKRSEALEKRESKVIREEARNAEEKVANAEEKAANKVSNKEDRDAIRSERKQLTVEFHGIKGALLKRAKGKEKERLLAIEI